MVVVVVEVEVELEMLDNMMVLESANVFYTVRQRLDLVSVWVAALSPSPSAVAAKEETNRRDGERTNGTRLWQDTKTGCWEE